MKMNVSRLGLQLAFLRQMVSCWSFSSVLYRLPGSRVVTMSKHEVTRLEVLQPGQELRVLKGVLWLTGPLTGDILLRAGDTFQSPRKGPFVVEALAEAEWMLLD